MTTALEIVLGVAIVVVAASFLGAIFGRVSDRLLAQLAGLMALLTVVTAVVIVVGLAIDRFSWRELAITLGGFLAVTCAEVGALGLARGLQRIRSIEWEQASLLEQLGTALDAHVQVRLTELEQTLARERDLLE